MGQRERQQGGFTMVEVLLATSILVMLSLGIAAGLSAGIRAWESGERNLDKYQSKRIVMERLYREISNAVHERGSREEDQRFEMIFNGEADSLSLVTTSESVFSPGFPMGLKEITMHAEAGEGLVVHEAVFSNRDFFDSDRGDSYVLDPSITGIQFRYLYMPRPDRDTSFAEIEMEWLDSWGPEHIEIEEVVEESGTDTRVRDREIRHRLPMAVEVTITAYNPEKDTDETWEPMIIPLMESRSMGISVKRRPRR